MLGVGPDGHVASLFPGHPALDVDDRIAVAVTDSPKPPPDRVRLTFEAINRAGPCGSWSAATARPTPSPAPWPATTVHEIPAARRRRQDETVWFLDEAAASALVTGHLWALTARRPGTSWHAQPADRALRAPLTSDRAAGTLQSRPGTRAQAPARRGRLQPGAPDRLRAVDVLLGEDLMTQCTSVRASAAGPRRASSSSPWNSSPKYSAAKRTSGSPRSIRYLGVPSSSCTQIWVVGPAVCRPRTSAAGARSPVATPHRRRRARARRRSWTTPRCPLNRSISPTSCSRCHAEAEEPVDGRKRVVPPQQPAQVAGGAKGCRDRHDRRHPRCPLQSGAVIPLLTPARLILLSLRL